MSTKRLISWYKELAESANIIIHDHSDDYIILEWSITPGKIQVLTTLNKYIINFYSDSICFTVLGSKSLSFKSKPNFNDWFDIKNNKYSFNKEKLLIQISRLEKLQFL